MDFIFGGAVAYFKECEIFSVMPEKTPSESVDGKTVFGYITAASTPPDIPYGLVFDSCRLTGECPKGSVMLGRPWGKCAKTVFLNCYMNEHIHSQGWSDWNKPTDGFFYAEYHSNGSDADPEGRVYYSHQLNDKTASEYTSGRILQGWNTK